MDEMAFKFGITTAQWNKHYLARWLYSQPAVDVGGESRYSSDGYFLLRYLIEEVLESENKTFEEYLARTWGSTITLHNPGLGYSLVMISNNSGNFDGLVPRMEAITDSFDANPCGFALDDPRVNPVGPHYIQNVHEQE